MDKQTFLSLLRERLAEYNVTEPNINKYIRQFERYFNTMTDDEINDQIQNYEGVDGIARSIIKLINKKQSNEQNAAESNIDSADSKDINIATTTYPVIQLKDENVTSDHSYKSDDNTENNPAEEEFLLKRKTAHGFVPAKMHESPAADMKAKKTGQVKNITQMKSSAYDMNTSGTGIHPIRNEPPNIDFNKLDESYSQETAIPATALYWIILILTIPITAPLFLTVLLLFLAAFAALAIAVVILIGILILIIIAGTGISLIGIIYGITQIFSSLPIGLFEIGFGVIIGGSAMLAGILVYNIAVRFLPFVIRYLFVFFIFTMNKIKDLLKLIKRECAKQ